MQNSQPPPAHAWQPLSALQGCGTQCCDKASALQSHKWRHERHKMLASSARAGQHTKAWPVPLHALGPSSRVNCIQVGLTERWVCCCCITTPSGLLNELCAHGSVAGGRGSSRIGGRGVAADHRRRCGRRRRRRCRRRRAGCDRAARHCRSGRRGRRSRRRRRGAGCRRGAGSACTRVGRVLLGLIRSRDVAAMQVAADAARAVPARIDMVSARVFTPRRLSWILTPRLV